MGTKRKSRSRSVLGDALHKLIEQYHPGGLPIGTAAIRLYGSDTKRYRERIYRLAGALRKNNIMVYSFGGRYHLCNQDPVRLYEVATQRQVVAAAMLQNALLLREKAIEAGLAPDRKNRLEKAFHDLRELVLNLSSAV